MAEPPPLDYDVLAVDYAAGRKVHAAVLQGILREGGIRPGVRVLEVGCGTGNYVSAIAASMRCCCLGIDPSAAMLAVARARPEAVRWTKGVSEALPLAAGCLDLVFSVDVIHHVRNREAYYSEVHRLLRPGGRLCTVTDSEWIIRNRRPLSEYFPATVDVELRRYPPIAELRRLMAEAGLEILAHRIVESRSELADIRAYESKAFSSLHLISEEEYRMGIDRMRKDLLLGTDPLGVQVRDAVGKKDVRQWRSLLSATSRVP